MNTTIFKSIKENGRYQNLNNQKMRFSFKKFSKIINQMIRKKNTVPEMQIIREKIDIDKFSKTDSLVWLGHSSILGNLNNIKFLADPMFSKRASPFKNIGPKRFDGSEIFFDELPEAIDIILITHNHYDHLDKKTVLFLQNRVQYFLVPLDNGKILKKWGIKEEKIKEFDWFDEFIFDEVEFTFLPTQHFSGRTLSDRNKYLWGSWSVKNLKNKSHSVYISGDSGYGEHFKLINQKIKDFAIACVECGAYNPNWEEVHMLPEQSVHASLDLNATVMLPMHWAGFDLSSHSWKEPVERALIEAKFSNQKITTPKIGEVLLFNNLISEEKWWRKLN
jgi:L-ascorbate metabolism protein UlaG (beta-lactamase superfamily)